MRVIAERLHDWGLLPVSVEESLSPQGQQHRRWLACGVAHHLGLDVHDCAQARYEVLIKGAKINARHDLHHRARPVTSARMIC